MADFSSWSSHIGALLDDTQRNLGLLPLSNQRTHAQNGLNAGPATAAYTSRIGLPYTTASATPGSNLSASLLRADRAPVRLALDASIPPEAGNFGRSASAARLTAARAPSSPVYRSSAVTATAQPASLVAALNLSPSHHRALAATAAVSLAEPPTPLGSFARGTPSGDDPILSEARLTRVDDELSRIRSELNNRFEERLQDFEKREGRSIADLRSEFQMREQEQRAAARQELHALRVEIESKSEELAARSQDAARLQAQWRSVASSALSRADLDALSQTTEQKLVAVEARVDSAQRATISSIDERWSSWSAQQSRFAADLSERLNRDHARIDDLDAKLRTQVPSKDELVRALEQVEIRRASSEAALRTEHVAHEQAQSDAAHALKLSLDAAQRATEQRFESVRARMGELAPVHALESLSAELKQMQESQAIKHDQLTRSLDNKATLQQLDTLKEGVALRDAAVNANFGTLDQRHSEVQEMVRRLFDTVREQASAVQTQMTEFSEQILQQTETQQHMQDMLTDVTVSKSDGVPADINQAVQTQFSALAAELEQYLHSQLEQRADEPVALLHEAQAKLTTKVEILSATMRRAQTNSTDSLTDSSSAQSEQGLAVGFDLDYITSMVDDRINAAHDLNVRPLLNDLADSVAALTHLNETQQKLASARRHDSSAAPVHVDSSGLDAIAWQRALDEQRRYCDARLSQVYDECQRSVMQAQTTADMLTLEWRLSKVNPSMNQPEEALATERRLVSATAELHAQQADLSSQMHSAMQMFEVQAAELRASQAEQQRCIDQYLTTPTHTPNSVGTRIAGDEIAEHRATIREQKDVVQQLIATVQQQYHQHEQTRTEWQAWRIATHNEIDELRATIDRMQQRAQLQEARIEQLLMPASQAQFDGQFNASVQSAPQIDQLKREFQTLQSRVVDESHIESDDPLEHSRRLLLEHLVANFQSRLVALENHQVASAPAPTAPTAPSPTLMLHTSSSAQDLASPSAFNASTLHASMSSPAGLHIRHTASHDDVGHDTVDTASADLNASQTVSEHEISVQLSPRRDSSPLVPIVVSTPPIEEPIEEEIVAVAPAPVVVVTKAPITHVQQLATKSTLVASLLASDHLTGVASQAPIADSQTHEAAAVIVAAGSRSSDESVAQSLWSSVAHQQSIALQEAEANAAAAADKAAAERAEAKRVETLGNALAVAEAHVEAVRAQEAAETRLKGALDSAFRISEAHLPVLTPESGKSKIKEKASAQKLNTTLDLRKVNAQPNELLVAANLASSQPPSTSGLIDLRSVSSKVADAAPTNSVAVVPSQSTQVMAAGKLMTLNTNPIGNKDVSLNLDDSGFLTDDSFDTFSPLAPKQKPTFSLAAAVKPLVAPPALPPKPASPQPKAPEPVPVPALALAQVASPVSVDKNSVSAPVVVLPASSPLPPARRTPKDFGLDDNSFDDASLEFNDSIDDALLFPDMNKTKK